MRLYDWMCPCVLVGGMIKFRFDDTRTYPPPSTPPLPTAGLGGGDFGGADPMELLAELGGLGDGDMRKLVDEAFNVRAWVVVIVVVFVVVCGGGVGVFSEHAWVGWRRSSCGVV